MAASSLRRLAETDEIIIGFERPDGSSGSTPVWVVSVDDDVFVRSMKGIKGGWYRRLRDHPDGEVQAGGQVQPVHAEPVEDSATLAEVTRAYGSKYGDSPYVGSLLNEDSARATLRLTPR